MLGFASYSQGSSSLCRFFISRILYCQFCIFLHFFLISPHDTGFRNKQLHKKVWEKIRIFYFARSFRVFQLNKTEQERKVTKQTRFLLHFASKSIKIYLVVLENELFEVAWLVPKKSQKRKHVDHTVMFYISNLNGYIRPCRRDVCVFVLETFLIPPMQLQTTCSPRLLNGF